MQSKTNRQVSYDEVELSLENVDNTEVVDEFDKQIQDSDSHASQSLHELAIETTQVISSPRSTSNHGQDNVMYTAAFMLFGVLIVVSLYAGLVFM